jgi:hypothetical protein
MKNLITFLCLIIVTLLLLSNNLKAQKTNPDHKRTMHWYFGNKAGLDFSNGHPVADPSGQLSTVSSGNATISDTNGNLLFYTEGRTVWNRYHNKMPNGTGLGTTTTAHDAVVIIPKPGDNNIYYIFSVDGWENGTKSAMCYSMVDMSLDNSKGDIIQKRIKLFSRCTGQLSATKDSSKCGYWVVGHEFSTANFRAYHITSSGLDTVPVISSTGTHYTQQYYYLGGGISFKFAPDGKWLASWGFYNLGPKRIPDFIDIVKFNKNNGIFSKIVTMPIDTSINGYGISPNSKYLYYEGGYYVAHDWQIDIISEDSSTILNSKILINVPKGYGIAEDWQIGYDGKIYMCSEVNGDSLSLVNNPNIKGIGCGIKKNFLSLAGRTPTQELPRFVTNFTIDDTSSICTGSGIIEITKENTLSIYPNPANDWIYIKSDIPVLEIKIVDLMGITIYEAHRIRDLPFISCQSFVNGIYIIQLLNTNYKTITSKLIVQH